MAKELTNSSINLPPTYSLMDKLFRQTSELLMDFVIPHKKNNPRMELSSDPLFLD